MALVEVEVEEAEADIDPEAVSEGVIEEEEAEEEALELAMGIEVAEELLAIIEEEGVAALFWLTRGVEEAEGSIVEVERVSSVMRESVGVAIGSIES